MDRLIVGKNMFVHLFFGVMLGWLYAILKVQLYGGDAPWISIFREAAAPRQASAAQMLLAPEQTQAGDLLASQNISVDVLMHTPR